MLFQNTMTEIDLAIKKALSAEEDELLEILGSRLMAINMEPSLAGSYEPALPYAQPENFSETFQELGQRVVIRLSKELYQLLCGQNPNDKGDRQKIAEALGLGEVTTAATLASVLVSSFGIAPAIAIIVSVIMVKRVCAPTLEEACKLWEEKL